MRSTMTLCQNDVHAVLSRPFYNDQSANFYPHFAQNLVSSLSVHMKRQKSKGEQLGNDEEQKLMG